MSVLRGTPADQRLVTAGLDGTLRSWQYAAQSGLGLTGRRAMHAGLTCVDYTSNVLAVGTDTGVAYLLHPDTAFDGPDYPPVRACLCRSLPARSVRSPMLRGRYEVVVVAHRLQRRWRWSERLEASLDGCTPRWIRELAAFRIFTSHLG
jgi:hypothetical protein